MRTVSKRGPHPLDAFKKVLEVNTVGSFNVIRLAAARMSKVVGGGGGKSCVGGWEGSHKNGAASPN